MENETDHDEVNLRGQSVGYRTCKICGKTFAKDMQHPKRQKCPECYINYNSIHLPEVNRTNASFREMKRCEEIEAQKRRERQRLRDAAWARWERENGRQVVVEDRGTCVVEIRGHLFVGCHAVGHVSHNS